MASRFSAAREFVQNKANQKREMNSVDALVKEAQLAELGFGVQRKPEVMGGLFGGGYQGITRDPNFISTKELERQKLQGDIDDINFKRQLRDQYTQGGGFGMANDTNSPTVFDPLSGKMTPNKAYVTPYQKWKMGQSDGLTPGQRTAKDKQTDEIFGLVETNKVQREGVKKAKESLQNIPTGLSGKIKIGLMKAFNPENATLQDWQNVKSALTEAQLRYTQKTKGAISDKEMGMFAQAVANDDLASVARMAPQLDKLLNFMDAEENAQFGSYQKKYGEDARTWFGEGSEGETNTVPEWAVGNEDFYNEAKKFNYTDEEIMKKLGVSA